MSGSTPAPAPVLVTGGAGYIGSHTCKALARAGYLPVTYDNLETGFRHNVKWGPLEEGDILDGTRLREVLARYPFVAALHFASLVRVDESVAQPEKYRRAIVDGSRTLVDALLETGVSKLVFSSTAAVYGAPELAPGILIREDHPKAPINPYGQYKWEVEQYLEAATTRGLRSVRLRYFNAAGSDPDGELTEEHNPPLHLIPIIFRALRDDKPFTIFGEDYPTKDGTCVRDYIHVSDLAEAHLLALKYLDDAGASAPLTRAFNLGTGAGYSVRQIVDACRKTAAKPLEVRVGPRRAGDPPSLIADSSGAQRELRWHPRHSSLPEIVGSAWRNTAGR
ncbi:MAG: UDP-glucose 4-epimerase GalE [Bacteriovoracia bacterium]